MCVKLQIWRAAALRLRHLGCSLPLEGGQPTSVSSKHQGEVFYIGLGEREFCRFQGLS